MTVYYKATRPDGTDFHSGTIRYQVGTVVEHPAKRRKRNDPSTYLSVSTVPTDCIGFRWPCRLFAVEGIGRPLTARNLPNKRCFSRLTVVEELQAWQVFGPQGAEVADLIVRIGRMTTAEVKHWDAAWAAGRDAAWGAAWAAAGDAARDAAWAAAGDAAWDAARDAAWGAAWDAVLALVVRDLITADQFDTLYGPWASVMEA